MKQQVKKMILLVTFGFIVSIAYSQRNLQITAPWASEKGYWIVEDNIHDPMNHTIRFYNTENKLVHTEQLSGMKLNINKKKTKMKLKQALETAVSLYEQHRAPSAIKDDVAKILK